MKIHDGVKDLALHDKTTKGPCGYRCRESSKDSTQGKGGKVFEIGGIGNGGFHPSCQERVQGRRKGDWLEVVVNRDKSSDLQ